jgi:hypothetical protein
LEDSGPPRNKGPSKSDGRPLKARMALNNQRNDNDDRKKPCLDTPVALNLVWSKTPGGSSNKHQKTLLLV